jgi:hypothetical protein
MVRVRTICPSGESCLDPRNCIVCIRYYKDAETKQANEIDRLRAALAEAERERDVAREPLIAVATRRELKEAIARAERAEAALAESERERDEARDDRLRYRCQVNALEQLGIAAEKAWTEKLKHIEADLAAAREVIDRYRYAIAFAAADAWDGGYDIRQRFEWARTNDPGGHMTNNRVAEIGRAFLEARRYRAK